MTCWRRHRPSQGMGLWFKASRQRLQSRQSLAKLEENTIVRICLMYKIIYTYISVYIYIYCINIHICTHIIQYI